MAAAYNKFETDGYHIINNSFGVDRYNDGSCGGAAALTALSTWERWFQATAKDAIFLKILNPVGTSGAYNSNMLFVFAAGNGRLVNGRQGCSLNTDGCNLYAATTLWLRGNGTDKAGDRVIFVGALADNSNTMAAYSHHAGEMKNDYLVAHDDVLHFGDLGGTSFAAPRVAGAAALVRHKFPNLNGPQLKQVLLQTADDLGAAGVDAVFGWGKLNVLNALSPIGKLQPIPTFPTGYDGTKGTESSRANAETAFTNLRKTGGILALFSNPYGVDDPNNQTSCAAVNLVDPDDLCYQELKTGPDPKATTLPRPTLDTESDKAWDLGWTGKGVKVGVVDEFTSAQVGLLAHGYATRAIVAQMAPEADIGHVSLSLRLSGNIMTDITNLDGVAKTAYDTLQTSQHYIINSSFGVDPFRSDGFSPNDAQFDDYVDHQLATALFTKMMTPAANSSSYHEDMLFVNSAGNSGEKCTEGLHKCRISAAALLKLRKTVENAGDRIIYVGALEDDIDPSDTTKSTTLADYSIKAGQLKHDYIVAHDDVWQNGDAGGTSFSAPRVAGAAALVRHKFPKLNAPQLKQVLLQTADDLGAVGPDEVFGYGRLNVLGALSPIGKLSVQ